MKYQVVESYTDAKQKQDDELKKFTEEFEKEIERERARILRNLLRYFGGNK